MKSVRDDGSFNLKRDASPLATMLCVVGGKRHACFNLKRDASPLATSRLHAPTVLC